jgi:hypothetical protein
MAKPFLPGGTLNPTYYNGHRFRLTDAAIADSFLDKPIIGRSCRVYKVSPGDGAVQISYRVRDEVNGKPVAITCSALLSAKQTLTFLKRV